MICFVIALEGEAAPVVANMQDAGHEIVYNKKVYSGKLCGEDVRVIICGVGKVNAALGTAMAVGRYGAEAIINAGTAGALNASMQVGGIYAVGRAAEYDFDLRQINGTAMGVLNEFEDRWLTLPVADGYAVKKLATGDRFNDDIADFKMLTGDFKADLRDMEGAAMAHVCAHTGTPLFMFKTVSDIAGSGSTTEQYGRNIALCYKNLESETKDIFNAAIQKLRG